MEMKKNLKKVNSSYKYGCYHVGRTDMWGNYCPETGEFYLVHDAGKYIEQLASGVYMPDGSWQEAADCGYSYEVVRELLQLGHLTSKTLATFIEEDGEVWWDQPNYSYITAFGGNRICWETAAQTIMKIG